MSSRCDSRLESGSPAIDAGARIASWGGADLWGTTLTGAPDIGAKQFR